MANARWYERHVAGEYLRVLWSASLKLALRVESGRDDGSRASRTIVRLDATAMPTQPWNALAAYTRKEYTDLLD